MPLRSVIKMQSPRASFLVQEVICAPGSLHLTFMGLCLGTVSINSKLYRSMLYKIFRYAILGEPIVDPQLGQKVVNPQSDLSRPCHCLALINFNGSVAER